MNNKLIDLDLIPDSKFIPESVEILINELKNANVIEIKTLIKDNDDYITDIYFTVNDNTNFVLLFEAVGNFLPNDFVKISDNNYFIS